MPFPPGSSRPKLWDDLPTRSVRALMCGCADNRIISQLEAEGYPWIGCECCKGTVWVPVQDAPRANTDAECHDARPTGRKDGVAINAASARSDTILQNRTTRPGLFEAFRCPGPAPSTILSNRRRVRSS